MEIMKDGDEGKRKPTSGEEEHTYQAPVLTKIMSHIVNPLITSRDCNRFFGCVRGGAVAVTMFVSAFINGSNCASLALLCTDISVL